MFLTYQVKALQPQIEVTEIKSKSSKKKFEISWNKKFEAMEARQSVIK